MMSLEAESVNLAPEREVLSRSRDTTPREREEYNLSPERGDPLAEVFTFY